MFALCQGKHVCSRHEWIHCGLQLSMAVIADSQRDHKFPGDTERPPQLTVDCCQGCQASEALFTEAAKSVCVRPVVEISYTPNSGPFLSKEKLWWIELAANKPMQKCGAKAITETRFHFALTRPKATREDEEEEAALHSFLSSESLWSWWVDVILEKGQKMGRLKEQT